MENNLENVFNKVKDGGVILLYGEIGVGKTTFIKKLAEKFAIDGFKVKSPTYNYIRKYKIRDNKYFIHIDLYRIDNIDEILLEEILEEVENPQNIIAIEWADRIDQYIKKPFLTIEMEYKGEEREMKVLDQTI